MASELTEVLFGIKRGLAAYVSYLSACEMEESFSEYVLYEPMLRIMTAGGFDVECEYACPGLAHAAVGDKKRIDFYAKGHGHEFAIEVKWAKSSRPNIQKDKEKLLAFRQARSKSTQLICVFGKMADISDLSIPGSKERGKPRYADLGRTKYGCRIYALTAKPKTIRYPGTTSRKRVDWKRS